MKLVREHINEKFTEEGDPIRDLGIGGKHIREFDTVKDAADFFLDNINILTRFKSISHLKSVMRNYDLPQSGPSLLREVK